MVIDSAPRPGGQYWRHLSQVEGYKSGRSAKVLQSPGREQADHSTSVVLRSGAQFTLKMELLSTILRLELNHQLQLTRVILATGAHDRAIPFTGWERPGVMTPGAAQALLKGHNVIAGQRILITGTGPFLLPVAVGLAAAGADVAGIIEAHSPLRWLKSPLALLLNPQKSIELIYYARKIAQYKLKVSFGRAVVAFDGKSATIAKIDSELRIKQKEL